MSGEQSGRVYTRIETTRPQEAGSVLHVHPGAAKPYYVLEGEYSIRYGEKEIFAKIGDFVFIPKGGPHDYRFEQQGDKCWSYRW